VEYKINSFIFIPERRIWTDEALYLSSISIKDNTSREKNKISLLVFYYNVEGNTVKFEYLVSRGQAYDKHILSNLQKKITNKFSKRS